MQAQIEQQLQANIKDIEKLQVQVEGSSCGGAAIDLLIVAGEFQGMTLVKRHQRIHEVLEKLENFSFHKMTIKAHTLEEYQKKLAKEASK